MRTASICVLAASALFAATACTPGYDQAGPLIVGDLDAGASYHLCAPANAAPERYIAAREISLADPTTVATIVSVHAQESSNVHIVQGPEVAPVLRDGWTLLLPEDALHDFPELAQSYAKRTPASGYEIGADDAIGILFLVERVDASREGTLGQFAVTYEVNGIRHTTLSNTDYRIGSSAC